MHDAEQSQLVKWYQRNRSDIMSSFSIAFGALATYISSATTAASTVSVFPLHGLGQDHREKVLEYLQHHTSTQSINFQNATHINMFSNYRNESQIECSPNVTITTTAMDSTYIRF
jgi:hypothetical protein